MLRSLPFALVLVRVVSANFLAPETGSIVPPLSPTGPKTPIRVLISHFQDGERCGRTLGTALENAAQPERVFFSMMQAISNDTTDAETDADCVTVFKEKYLPKLCADGGARCRTAILSRVQSWSIPLEEGMGATHQRGLLAEKVDYGGIGDMCMDIDAHMGFAKDWDNVMLQDWESTHNEFAVLTTYPNMLNTPLKGSFLPILCGWDDDGDGIPRGKRAELYQVTGQPPLTPGYAAGLSFGRCHMDKNVPVDKNLRWIFDGEEINKAVRLWTHGYDLYAPQTNAVTHDYDNARQNFWAHAKTPGSISADGSISKQRIKTLLHLSDDKMDLGPYILGTQRTLQQYNSFTEFKGPCAARQRVPVNNQRELKRSVTRYFS